MGKHGNPRPESANRKGGETTKRKYAFRHFIKRRDKIDSLLCGDSIECEICGEILGQLSKHLVFKHGITIGQYKEIYPDALTVATNISRMMANENTKKWDDPEYKDRVSKTISDVVSQQWDNNEYSKTQTGDHKTKKNLAISKTKQENPRFGEDAGNWKVVYRLIYIALNLMKNAVNRIEKNMIDVVSCAIY